MALEALEDRALLSLDGQQLFPADNPWNQSVAGAPTAANSQAIINNIISLDGSGNLHPDFGQVTGSGPLYGIPYNIVHGNTQPKVHVVIDAYADQSDVEDAPIPANAVLEGDQQNGPTVGVNNRGDSHLIVFDVDNDIAYEFYRASRPSENSDGQWHADAEAVWDMKVNTFRTIGWTSADAAGLPILPGLVRPDEGLPTSQGGQGAIDHAIRFTLRNNIILDQFIYPAEHIADSNTNASVDPPMGMRFRLKANVDISQLNPEAKIVAQALKTYGMILADNGSNFYISGASQSVEPNGQTLTWNDADIQDTVHGLKSLPFSDFEVVDLTPQVTGLSATSGSAGSTITITGQNFSGAAGHLQVLFGSTPATNVTVVDDGHVTATVPSGTGTVDVRVQSGVTTASDSQNFKNPIFGYGISAVSASDQFTYTSGSNQPPTASNVTSTTTANTPVTINVLSHASDSDGDTLTVSSVTQPSGGTAAINQDNTVTYTPKSGFTGTDTFNYTVSDGHGNQATAAVSVTVSAVSSTKWIVNVGDPGYVEAGTAWSSGWGTDPAGKPYRDAYPVDAAWATPSTATWSVSSLPAGTYQVYATWIAGPYVASNAPFSVLDGTKSLASLAVNERQAPADVVDGGRGWKSLGTYSISSGTLSVRLTNNDANDTVQADAIRIVQVSAGGNQPPVAANLSASTTAGQSVNVDVLASASDSDGDTLSVASVTQPAHGTAVINADQTVTYSPATGFVGQDSFSYEVSDGHGGTATATVAVTVNSASATKWFVNVGDPGYTQSGSAWSNGWGTDGAGDPYRLAYQINPAWGATPSTATWSLNGLAKGTYQVFVTWVASPYRASNAPFTVLDGSQVVGQASVDERVAPNDVTDGGRGWKSVGSFSVSSGSLSVRLSNSLADNIVVADAIRVVRLS